MEQHKLERQFREQLNSREIKPSEMAWEKLDAMLSVAQKPKAKFPWLYVAASFVGFILIAMFYFSPKENTIENQKNGVVIQHSVAPKANVIPSDKINFKIEKKGSADNVVQQLVLKKDNLSVLKNDSLTNKNKFNQNQVTELSIINQKKEQESISNINEKSVDEMLAAVKVTLKSDISKKALKVNSNVLLSQVDEELELSFREKVIEKANKNYQTVKVALGNRNQE